MGLAVPSRLFGGWILVHHWRHWWRMCAVSDRVTNADLPTSRPSLAEEVTTSVHFSLFSSESHRLDLHCEIFRSDPGGRMWLCPVMSSWFPSVPSDEFTHDISKQGWPNSTQRGSHNSLRTRLTAALVYTYIEKWELNQINRRCLYTISYTKSTVECTGYNTKNIVYFVLS
jgi:hypothetical protein